MPSEEDQLRHDASSLYQFVDSIASFCGERSRAVTYLHATERFFFYVRDLGEKTKAYLVSFPTARSKYLDVQTYRRKLSILRAAWKVLHQFVKPATEADTLNLPSPLIDGLIRRFREIPTYSKVDFVIFHTDEFNYLQVRLSKLKRSIDRIADIIPGASPFYAELGLIGIPYSQCSSLFMNCLIPHEMGHYVYADQEIHAKLLPKIESEIKRTTTFKAVRRSYLIKTIAAWAEELFCDLFAVLLVGPCYTLAYVELFDLVHALDENGKLAAEEDLDSLTFYPAHPAHIVRIKHQVQLLDELKWWPKTQTMNSHYVDVMKASLTMPENSFKFRLLSNMPSLPGAKPVKSFQVIIPEIRKLLQPIRTQIDVGVGEWSRLSKVIEEYLANGIVPSTLYFGKNKKSLKMETPGIVPLLNASYKFYLDSMGSLLKRIDVSKDGGPASVKARSKWASKVEEWTMKAIEDNTLLASQQGNGNASSFKKRN